MTYATRADLIARYGETELIQLTDRADPPAGAIDDAQLAPALAFADQLIDSLVSNRYTVPLAPVPGIVTDYAADIARYRLYGDAPSDEVRARFDQALKFLHDVQASRANLPAATTTTAPAGGGVQFSGSPRVFGRDTLGDY